MSARVVIPYREAYTL
jgi:Rab GDP dissociation inhibitor